MVGITINPSQEKEVATGKEIIVVGTTGGARVDLEDMTRIHRHQRTVPRSLDEEMSDGRIGLCVINSRVSCNSSSTNGHNLRRLARICVSK